MPTQNEIQQKFKELPQDLRDAIFSVDTADIIQAIAKRHNLPIDKMGELADEVGLLILGTTRPKDFVSHLARRLDADIEKARKIAEEVNTQIFAKIKESLKKVHTLEEEEIIKKVEAPTPPTKPEPKELPVNQMQPKKSPFEEKLQEKIFTTQSPVQKEVEQAKKENRYPMKQDPYRESVE
ncbi:hypothetical protein IIA95_00025 [Patescibacteria group bacterium]|nr:hypothetical protein [Patescibacteria group bacterium]